MKPRLCRILSPAARVLSVLLIITPILLPLMVIPYSLAFPPAKEVSPLWSDYPLPWDMPTLIVRYLHSLFFIPSLITLAAGLWLWRPPLSWIKVAIALMATIPWFWLVTSICSRMLDKMPIR